MKWTYSVKPTNCQRTQQQTKTLKRLRQSAPRYRESTHARTHAQHTTHTCREQRREEEGEKILHTTTNTEWGSLELLVLVEEFHTLVFLFEKFHEELRSLFVSVTAELRNRNSPKVEMCCHCGSKFTFKSNTWFIQ